MSFAILFSVLACVKPGESSIPAPSSESIQPVAQPVTAPIQSVDSTMADFASSESFGYRGIPLVLYRSRCVAESLSVARLHASLSKWVQSPEEYLGMFEQEVPHLACSQDTIDDDYPQVLGFYRRHLELINTAAIQQASLTNND